MSSEAANNDLVAAIIESFQIDSSNTSGFRCMSSIVENRRRRLNTPHRVKADTVAGQDVASMIMLGQMTMSSIKGGRRSLHSSPSKDLLGIWAVCSLDHGTVDRA